MEVDGRDPAARSAAAARALVGLVPADARPTCCTSTRVDAECAQADRDAGADAGHAAGPCSTGSSRTSTATSTPATCPRASASASCWRCSSRPPRRSSSSTSRPAASTTAPRTGCGAVLHELAGAGHAVVVATHDVEFVAAAADEVDRAGRRRGRRRRAAPTRSSASSPAFAPQVAKVLQPEVWLTVDEVAGPSAASRRPAPKRAVTAVARRPGSAAPGRAGPGSGRAGRRPHLVGRAGDVLLAAAPAARATASPTASTRRSSFVLLLPALLAVVLAEVAEGGLDAKALAMLGVLSALGAALRPMGAGTAGIETIFFLLVLAGRVYGPGFGFVLGSTTLFTSALLTGGVGPVAAVPDAGVVVGRDGRRAPPARVGPPRAGAAGRLRRRGRLRATASS